MALSNSCTVQPYVHCVQEHLSAQERQARERIAAAEAKATTGTSSRLHAARLYKQSTDAKFAEALKAYRAMQERDAAMPPPRRSVLDRLLGRQAASNGAEAIHGELAILHAGLIAASRAASGAAGNLARVEQAEAHDHRSRLEHLEMERRAAQEALSEVATARRLVHLFPSVIYSGPAFVSYAGGKLERVRRRKVRNPQAKTIWGLPIDFG